MSSTVTIDIELVTSAFKTALQGATNQAKQFQTQASSSFNAVGTSFAVMAGSLAANAFQKVASSIIGALNNVIDEAASSEQAIQNLNIALKSAGLYSLKASQELQDFASKLQAITIYSDEAIMASSGLLLSLTNLDQKGIQAATRAAADLAATLNIDLGTASEMIAKAVNGNTTGFKKIGIEIEKADTDSARLTNTLKALSTQHGAAEAATNTYAGAIAKSKNQQSELLEALGKMITQNPAVIGAINAMSDAFTSMADWVTNNKKFLNDLGQTILIVTGVIAAGAIGFAAYSAAIGVLGIMAVTGTTALGALAIAARAAWLAATGPVGLVIAGVTAVGIAVYQVVKHWDDIKIAVYGAIAATLEYAAKAVGLLSADKAAGLQAEAQAWRDKAKAIQDASKVAQENGTVEDQQAAQRKAKLAAEAAEVARINANKVETARINAANLTAVEQERQLAEQEVLTASEQAKAQTVADFDATKLEQTVAAQEQQLVARQAYEQQLLQLQIDAELNKAKLETDAQARRDAIKVVNDKAALDKAKLNSKQHLDLVKLRVKSEADIEAKRVKNQSDTLATIATLQNSSNRELATIGKAAAITQIAIATPEAVAKAYTLGPIAGPIAAGLVYAAMAAQAAQVAGIKFADGGIVPGSNNTGDRIRAQLNSGEMVLNRGQQANLFKIANQGMTGTSQDNSRVEGLLVSLIDAVKSSTSIQIDGREIISVVRDGISSGRSIA